MNTFERIARRVERQHSERAGHRGVVGRHIITRGNFRSMFEDIETSIDLERFRSGEDVDVGVEPLVLRRRRRNRQAPNMPGTILVFDAGLHATKKDIAQRMEDQATRYLELVGSNDLSEEWIAFGRKNAGLIFQVQAKTQHRKGA